MKYNSIGEQLIAKAKELDPNYKPDKFNDMSEALDVVLNNSGGTTDYNQLENKPSINGISLEGNNTARSLFGVDIERTKITLRPQINPSYITSYNSSLTATTNYIALQFENDFYERMLSLYKDKITFTYCENWNKIDATQKLGFNFISQPSNFTPEYKDSNPSTIFKVIPDKSVNIDGVCIDNNRVEGNENNSLNYIPVVKDPTEDGTYTLKLIKSGETITYSWIKD